MFSGPDPDDVLELRDEDLPVADLAGLCLLDDRGEHLFRNVVRYHDFDLHLRQEGDIILRATVELDMALLPAEPLDFADGYPLDADLVERFLNFVQFERFDNRFDLFQG